MNQRYDGCTTPPIGTPYKTPPSLGVVLRGKYKLIELLGECESDWVFLAEHNTDASARFTVKFLKSQRMKQAGLFHDQLRSIAALKSSSTVRVFEFGETDAGLPFIVMEYVQGLPLRAVIKALHVLNEVQVVRFGLDICRSLAEAHGLGILHGDLRPSNVLITKPMPNRHSAAMVSDFGYAQLFQTPSGGDAQATLETSFLRPPRYTAPESLLGEASAQSDLYSLAQVMAELLQGYPAYSQNDNNLLVVANCLEDKPVPLSARITSGALGPVIQKAVAKRCEERYSTILEFSKALERIQLEIGPKTDLAVKKHGRLRRGVDVGKKGAQEEHAGSTSPVDVKTATSSTTNQQSAPSEKQPPVLKRASKRTRPAHTKNGKQRQTSKRVKTKATAQSTAIAKLPFVRSPLNSKSNPQSLTKPIAMSRIEGTNTVPPATDPVKPKRESPKKTSDPLAKPKPTFAGKKPGTATNKPPKAKPDRPTETNSFRANSGPGHESRPGNVGLRGTPTDGSRPKQRIFGDPKDSDQKAPTNPRLRSPDVQLNFRAEHSGSRKQTPSSNGVGLRMKELGVSSPKIDGLSSPTSQHEIPDINNSASVGQGFVRGAGQQTTQVRTWPQLRGGGPPRLKSAKVV